MSIWADRQIHALNLKVEELEKRMYALEKEDKVNPPIPITPPDLRTKEGRAWKNANSSQ